MGRCGMSHYGSLFAASTWVPSTFIAQTSGRSSALSQLYLSVAPHSAGSLHLPLLSHPLHWPVPPLSWVSSSSVSSLGLFLLPL